MHGLEGNIQEGNTFYEDKHDLVGRADFVMANPPFNVDGVDKSKDAVKKDPRLMINGIVTLPRNDNANYLWIQYFYNYLKPTGRAGFVMASSASDAGNSEKDIRQKLVKTGAVDIMIAIGNNFFYTRSLPCTLWFFDRAKEQNTECRDKVLMLDARKIYRKVTSKVNDFSPEQLLNLICIVNLYRGNNKKFEATVSQYLQKSAELAKAAATATIELQKQLKHIFKILTDFAIQYGKENTEAQSFVDALNIEETESIYDQQDKFVEAVNLNLPEENVNINALENVSNLCKALRKPQDKLIKQLIDTINSGVKEYQLGKNKDWKALNLKVQLDQLKVLQQQVSGNSVEEEPGLLHETEYFFKQAQWLTSRFPEGIYRDVEGLCKVVNHIEIEAKEWSLSPGRYVGVDASSINDDFDYEHRLDEIHIELEGLNEEAFALAKVISENYKELTL